MNILRDVEFSRNNGFLAIRIVSTGRLKCLQQNLKVRKDDGIIEGDPRVWVFANEHHWTDSEGNERLHNHERGFLAGTHEDGEKFLRHCSMAGFEVEYAGFFVPLSNGERTIAVIREKPYADFPEFEQLMVRSGRYPSLQQLMDLLEREMGDTQVQKQEGTLEEPQQEGTLEPQKGDESDES